MKHCLMSIMRLKEFVKKGKKKRKKGKRKKKKKKKEKKINENEDLAPLILLSSLPLPLSHHQACSYFNAGSFLMQLPSSPLHHFISFHFISFFFFFFVKENRSFDHFLGWLKKYNPEIDGVTGKECNHLNASDPTSPQVRPSSLSTLSPPSNPQTFFSPSSPSKPFSHPPFTLQTFLTPSSPSKPFSHPPFTSKP